MEHEIVSSRRSGELWKIKCSCGWFIRSYRYICEEAHADHAAPAPQLEEEGPRLKWWDDASYLRYECDCDHEKEHEIAQQQYAEEARKAKGE